MRQLQQEIKYPILVKKKENLAYLTGEVFDLRTQEYLLVKPLKYADKRGSYTGVVGFGSGLEKISWAPKSDTLYNIGKYVKGYEKLNLEYGFTLGEHKYIKSKIKNLRLQVKVQPEHSPVDEIRQIKTPDEILKIKKSMEIVKQVYKYTRKQAVKSGMTEAILAKYIENLGLKLGAGELAFPAIVASGKNAAMPHHVPTKKRLKPGESIILDFGFLAGGQSATGGKSSSNYCSDFTRTVFIKKVPKKLEIAYNQVEKAYLGSMEYINSPNPRPNAAGGQASLKKREKFTISSSLTKRRQGGVRAEGVYQKSVEILAEKKLDKYFIHSLGHGTGLEIHERPYLGPKSKDILKEGMVFSIEPGVYFPEYGGVRIEDLVYMENGKVKKFIEVPTDLKSNIL